MLGFSRSRLVVFLEWMVSLLCMLFSCHFLEAWLRCSLHFLRSILGTSRNGPYDQHGAGLCPSEARR